MSLLCRHLRLTDDIIPQVYSEPLTDKPVVHLRGTDRNFTDSDWARLRQLARTAYVVSDDKVLIDRWKSESPDSIFISNPVQGVTHFSTDVDKHSMNIQLLREFFIIASASEAYPLNNDSLYFKMARMIGTCPQYKSLFNMS
jgi:hypothetical protein